MDIVIGLIVFDTIYIGLVKSTKQFIKEFPGSRSIGANIHETCIQFAKWLFSS